MWKSSRLASENRSFAYNSMEPRASTPSGPPIQAQETSAHARILTHLHSSTPPCGHNLTFCPCMNSHTSTPPCGHNLIFCPCTHSHTSTPPCGRNLTFCPCTYSHTSTPPYGHNLTFCSCTHSHTSTPTCGHNLTFCSCTVHSAFSTCCPMARALSVPTPDGFSASRACRPAVNVLFSRGMCSEGRVPACKV